MFLSLDRNPLDSPSIWHVPDTNRTLYLDS